MAGRDRTCGAPRFKRPLYRAELRPRGMGEAGFEPATSCVLDKHSGQAELLAHVMMRSSAKRGGTSVSAPLNNGVQSVASCRLDDPGKADGRRACPPSTSHGEVDAVAPVVTAVCWSFHGTFGRDRTMLSKPLACPSTLDHRLRRPTWRGFGARRSCCFGKRQAKAAGNSAANSACAKRRGAFLS